MLGNLAFGIPLGLAVVGVMIYLQIYGAPTPREKVIVAAVIAAVLFVHLGVGAWAWPIITPFEAPLWRCWYCGVELVHRFPLCPRCNAPSRLAPPDGVRAGRVIPCGSDESPATSGSV